MVGTLSDDCHIVGSDQFSTAGKIGIIIKLSERTKVYNGFIV